MSSRKAKAKKKKGPVPARPVWHPAICYCGMLIAAITAAFMTPHLFDPPSDQKRCDVTIMVISLGLGLGLLLIKMRWLEGWKQTGWARSEALSFAGCGIAMAIFSYWCGMRQFGGFDQSLIVEAGWRLYCGQKPYVDFPCLLPVGFYLGAEMAFRWFGVFWSSIIKFNIVYLLLTYIWLYLVLRLLIQNRYLALVIVITVESMSMVLDSFWWYNPITDITVAVYAVSLAAILLRPRDPWMWVSLCLSLVLAALMKPNESGVAIFGGTCALLLNKEVRWKCCITSLAAFLIWMGVLAIHGSNAVEVVGGYLGAASRGVSAKNFLHGTTWYEWILAWVFLCVLLPPWVRLVRWRNPAWLAMAVAVLLASLDGFYSNSEPKLVDLSPALLAVAFIVAEIEPEKRLLIIPPGWTAYLILLCTIFTMASINDAAARQRIRGIGLGAFFEYQMDDTPIQTGFFKGLRGSYDLRVAVNTISDYCATHPTDHIYFGPRLQWAYGAFHIPSPKGMPIWWDPNFGFPATDEDLYTTHWIDNKFDPLVMMDAMFFNDRLLNYIDGNYVVFQGYPLHPDAGALLYLKRKN